MCQADRRLKTAQNVQSKQIFERYVWNSWSYVHNMGEEPTFSMDARIPRVGLSEDRRLMLKKKKKKNN